MAQRYRWLAIGRGYLHHPLNPPHAMTTSPLFGEGEMEIEASLILSTTYFSICVISDV